MKKIRTLLVKFDNHLQPWEVPAFRGAVIEKVGREHILFNHHKGNKEYLFKYPVIQYKSLYHKPAIFCLGEGVDEIHKLFNKPTWEIQIRDRKLDLIIDNLYLGNATLNVWDKTFSYSIHNWLALNTNNFKKYAQFVDEISKTELLEKVLVGNILSFAKGVGWDIEREVKVKISKIIKIKNLKYKETHLLGFNIEFNANVSLPQYFGLGKGVSHGFGVVRQVRFKENENEQQ